MSLFFSHDHTLSCINRCRSTTSNYYKLMLNQSRLGPRPMASFPSLAVRSPLNHTASNGKLGEGLGTRLGPENLQEVEATVHFLYWMDSVWLWYKRTAVSGVHSQLLDYLNLSVEKSKRMWTLSTCTEVMCSLVFVLLFTRYNIAEVKPKRKCKTSLPTSTDSLNKSEMVQVCLNDVIKAQWRVLHFVECFATSLLTWFELKW